MIAMLMALGLLSKVGVTGNHDPQQARSGPRAVIGIGSQPCALAMSPGRKVEADTWVLGYWSGVNAAGTGNVAVVDGVSGMLAHVQAYCATHTGVPLQDAAQQVLAGKD